MCWHQILASCGMTWECLGQTSLCKINISTRASRVEIQEYWPHITMWDASGCSPTKSQKLLWAVWPWGTSLCGSGFTAWTKSGNLIASWMKNTGMLLPTISQFPSSVYIFRANPRTSRTVSALPLEPWTVLNLRNTGVVLDESVRTGAEVNLDALSSKTLK